MPEAQVIAAYGHQWILHDLDTQTRLQAKIRRKAGYAVTGDWVSYETDAITGDAVISSIHPRLRELSRADKKGSPKALAANFDQLIVVAAVLPQLEIYLIDVYLAYARLANIPVSLVINKIDLLSDQSDTDITSTVKRYQQLGYTVIKTQAMTQRAGQYVSADQTSDQLRSLLQDKISILVGQSGVGKSSLIQQYIDAADHDATLRVGNISEASGLGKHTTTNALMYRLRPSGQLIDSPGIRDFFPNHIEPASLDQGFVDFADYLGQCRFHNCTHIKEPRCAIKQAVEQGQINPERYENYQRLYDNLINPEINLNAWQY